MKTFFTILLFLFKTAFLFGQANYTEDYRDKTLLNLKNILEQSLAGTKIRDYSVSFIIEPDIKSSQYILSGDVLSMLSQVKIKKLNSNLNKVLKRKKSIKLSGTVHFDRFLDSCIISVGYYQVDAVYDFISLPNPISPSGGFEKFSKKLHDVIKDKINQRKISKDSLESSNNSNYIEFVVEKSGAITDVNRRYIGKALDSFFSAQRWNPGLYSFSVGIKAEFLLLKKYLLNKSHWIDQSAGVQNSTDYENAWAVLDMITPFKIGAQTTYFDSSLPTRKWKYHSVVSMVYDNILKKYRMPIVHFGSLSDTDQLIRDLDSSSQRYLGTQYGRVFFYRMK